MKEIKLTQDKVAIIDDEDYEYLNQFKWCAVNNKYTIFAAREPLGPHKIGRKLIFMHRIIMNTPPYLEVDHIDHNGLNNQKLNLRNCTHGENCRNRRNTRASKLFAEYKGVDVIKAPIPHPFRARITIDGDVIIVGYYDTPEEAARAYDEAAKKYHGEFANLNFK